MSLGSQKTFHTSSSYVSYRVFIEGNLDIIDRVIMRAYYGKSPSLPGAAICEGINHTSNLIRLPSKKAYLASLWVTMCDGVEGT